MPIPPSTSKSADSVPDTSVSSSASEAGKKEMASMKPLLSRILAVAVTLLVLGVIIGVFAMFHLDRLIEQLELKSYDLRAQILWGSSIQRPSKDIVILQFDDPSLSVLSDDFGTWPWPRDVHARMIRYLNKVGARRILYDIMFVSHRKGEEKQDKALADIFRASPNVYLSMNFDQGLEQNRKLGKDLTPHDIELLRPLSIPLQSDLAHVSHDSRLHLRYEPDGSVFFDNDHMTFNHYRSILPELLSVGKNIAIINHGADEDGVSRGNPLFFRFRYNAFLQTTHLPIQRKANGWWYDTQGQRTDADGYLLQRSTYPIDKRRPNGTFFDKAPGTPQIVDKEGYLMDDYGHFIYKRALKPSYLYFPYLGFRVMLDLKYPGKLPSIRLTANGHLKFGSDDIPLSANGDCLVTWYNVSLVREDQQRSQQEMMRYIENLKTTIQSLEQDLQVHPSDRIQRQNLAVHRQELQKAEFIEQRLDQMLKRDFVPQPYRTIAAWEVIRAMRRAEAGLPATTDDKILGENLRNKIVFVGTTAVATYDIKNTPIYSSFPGVIFQATLFDNLYHDKGRYMQRATPITNQWITIAICLLAAGLTLRVRSALVGVLTTVNIAILYILAAIILYQSMSLWINVAMPIVALIITTTLTFIAKYMLRNKDYEKTYALATTDGMTGLYNHRFFQDAMRQSIDQANRFKHSFSVLLIDIDFFKRFNDTYGHQTGDEVLRHVARKLQKSVRVIDIVARYGGEEMAIILARATQEEALSVASKIVKAVAEESHLIGNGEAKQVTISCGIATYPDHGLTASQLIEVADAGLYRAKTNGRNQVGSLPEQSDISAPPSEKTA